VSWGKIYAPLSPCLPPNQTAFWPRRNEILPTACFAKLPRLPSVLIGPWTYQRCGGVVIPAAIGDSNTVFLSCSQATPSCWNQTVAQFAKFCESIYGAAYRPQFNGIYYGATVADVGKLASNIVFTNGRLDPWGCGGYTGNNDTAKGVSSLWLAGSAHHLELRAPHQNDPGDVAAARVWQLERLQEWIKDYQVQQQQQMKQQQ